MTTFEQTFEELPLAGVHDLAAARHAEGWRYVQILAVNTEEGIDLVYSYMKDGHLANFNVSGVKQTDVVPSITDLYLEAFVCENEIHDLFDVAISDIAIDFGGGDGPHDRGEPRAAGGAREGEEDRRGLGRQGGEGGRTGRGANRPHRGGDPGQDRRARPREGRESEGGHGGQGQEGRGCRPGAGRSYGGGDRGQDSGPGSGKGREGARRHGSQGPKGRRREGRIA